MDGTAVQDDVKLNPEKTETPQSYTSEQLEKAVEKAVRDARTAVMADVGRTKAEADKALKAATDATERLRKLQKEQEEVELEAVKEEPDLLSAIRARHEARRLKSELEAKDAKLNELEGKIGEFTNKEREAVKLTIAQKVAAARKVDVNLLTKLAKFTDGTEEAIEEIAKDLPKARKSQEEEFTPDSNRSRGGSSQNVQDVQKDYITGKITTVQYSEKMKALGVMP